jgi:DNA repair exonuclease SbcCD ATPase subunit
MPDGRETTLAHVADLAARDELLATQIEGVTRLTRDVNDVRARAADVAAGLDALPAERAAAEGTLVEARRGVQDARVTQEQADVQLGRLEARRRVDAADLARARSEALDARQALVDAEHRVERLERRLDELEAADAALKHRAAALASEAATLAATLRDTPRVVGDATTPPVGGLDSVVDWGGRARAALFVARGTLETERDRVVAEANALAAAVLGEDPGAAGVALVRRRVEEALT